MTEPRGSVLVAGSANIDFVVRAPHIPAPGETVLGGDLTVVPGGKGANQAVACARAGGAATADVWRRWATIHLRRCWRRLDAGRV